MLKVDLCANGVGAYAPPLPTGLVYVVLIYSLTERTQYTVQVIGSPLEANFNPKNTVTKCLKSSLSLVNKINMLKGSGKDWEAGM